MLENREEERMIGIGSLDDDRAGLVPSSCSSADLCDELIGAFIRTKIRKVYHAVCIENTHETYMIKIKALCHHLRSHQYVRFLRSN